MGIDRYDLYVDEYEHEPDLHYHECGGWVRFEDHEQVVAELDQRAVAMKQWARHDCELIEELEAEITRLRAELAAKSKDAARYVWLRDNAMNDGADWSDVPSLAWSGDITIDNAEIDQAIDSAMGEGNGR